MIKINQLNQTLHAIKTTKATLKKQYEQETDEHTKQKIAHQIHCLSMEETRTLNQLNIRLEDITLTENDEEEQ